MRIIIAGGSGMIGRELTSLLLDAGDEVTVLSRNPRSMQGLPPGVQFVSWDGKTLQDWATEVEMADGVVNLTGENLSGPGLFPTRWTEERKQLLVSSRVDSSRVLTKAIEQASHKPSVFVQQSGVGYYGTQQEGECSESDRAGNDFPARLLIEWEKASQPVESMGVRRVVTRSAVVLSTKGGALRPLIMQYKLFVGGPIGGGRQALSWIHLIDEAAAIQFLIRNKNVSGVFNLSSPYPVTNDEFGHTLATVLRRPHYFPIPAFTMRLAFGEVASMLLEGQRVIPKKLVEAGFQFKFPTLQDALRDLLLR